MIPTRIQKLFGVGLPVIQAPMAGANGAELVVAVSEAGGLGSLPCATLSLAQMRAGLQAVTAGTAKPYHVNFFCHAPPPESAVAEQAWRIRLQPYFDEFGIGNAESPSGAARHPFDAAMCGLLEEFRPAVISFHFGLPAQPLLERARAAGAKIISSATTVAEARWLEDRGCDAIIAQGAEAGGHRGIFLPGDLNSQPGLIALLPQVADAVAVPVIAAGGIADARGVAAAFILGASAVQIGTAYLRTPEALTSLVHRAALAEASADSTALTNLFTGRPARGIVNRLMREQGPLSPEAPPFPLAANSVQPLRAAAEAIGSGDFSALWSGQSAALAKNISAAELTRGIMQGAEALLRGGR